MAEELSPAIEVDDSAAPSQWALDAGRFGPAVPGNLIRNAVQVSPQGRPPIARVAIEDGVLVFAIQGFGPGLEPGIERRIFDPFFTTRTNGTGLGLPVARRIAELHGGQISATNTPGAGALFRVTVPNRDR